MVRRRRFLETLSAVPFVGAWAAASGGGLAEAAAGRKGRDYFAELGVRPFINAAGTYTAMTASLMPPEVMDAIQYASHHFVMLDELHDKVGERIATLLKCRGRDGDLGRRIGAHPRHGGRAHRHGSPQGRRCCPTSPS